MKWNELKEVEQLDQIKKESKSQPILIFKHSTRCATSALALNRLERHWQKELTGELKPYYLDLIRYRNVSNLIEEHFGIAHQSPQAILIRDEVPVYHASHFGISLSEIARAGLDN